MAFLIKALSHTRFAHLYGASPDALAAAGARRVTVEANPGYPCRVSLRDARVGETVLLMNFEHQAEATPYRASHAIFVIEGAQQRALKENEVPDVLKTRLLSVRAFNRAHDMIAAEIGEGETLSDMIDALKANPETAYLHIHNAKPGCFAARVDFPDRPLA